MLSAVHGTPRSCPTTIGLGVAMGPVGPVGPVAPVANPTARSTPF